MENVRCALANIAQVFGNRRYLYLAVGVFVVSIVVLLALSRLDALFEMASFTYAFLTLASNAVLAGLFAVNVPLLVHRYKMLREVRGATSMVAGFGGMFGGVIGSGCPVCGSTALSLMGIAGGLSVLPFNGLELKFLGIMLMGYSTFSLGKQMSVCKTAESYRAGLWSRFSDYSTHLITRRTETWMTVALMITAVLVVFNQIQLSAMNASFSSIAGAGSGASLLFGRGDTSLKGVDVSQVTSTAMAVATVFPELKDAKTDQEFINIILPRGIPAYSELLGGVTFDDPVTSLDYLARLYPTMKQEAQNDPGLWQRYLGLAAAPTGISCEFCCGVGAQGIDEQGNLRCGCKHNPAVHALTLGLMKYSDYSDAQILREVMRWKAMFYPKNMVDIAMQVAGSDPSQLHDLPGMVGGC